MLLLTNICVCRCSVRHCKSFLKSIMSMHNRSAIPDSVLGADMCRVFLLALGGKKVSTVLPTWCLFSHRKEPFINGSQKPPWLSQRYAPEIQFEVEIAELVRTHPDSTSEVLSPGNNLWSGLDRPNLSSFPKIVISDPYMKESTEETRESFIPLCCGRFSTGLGGSNLALCFQ